MENSKYPWPRVRIGTTPETRQLNAIVEVFDAETLYRNDTASLAVLEEIAEQWNYPNLAQTLREYAEKGTR